jgi:hypothetical protein
LGQSRVLLYGINCFLPKRIIQPKIRDASTLAANGYNIPCAASLYTMMRLLTWRIRRSPES